MGRPRSELPTDLIVSPVIAFERMSTFQPTAIAINRILDANLDRAREGLRALEEWCRFGLDDTALTEECKTLRHELGSLHAAEFRAARNTPEDVGTSLDRPQEQQREDLQAVLQANFCRVQEALRVLEEYGKIERPHLAAACKQLRYRVYTLESKLQARDRRQQLQNARLYLVTSPSDRLLEIVEAALQGGLPLVQYRDKEADDVTRVVLGTQLRELCHRYGALFIMNDRVDLALATGADGVHLGQHDVSVAFARRVLGNDRLVGRSTTNPSELQSAIAEGADYVGVGAVYATPTKPGKAPSGLEYVRHAAATFSGPWYAIGGVALETLDEVLEAGAFGVAIVRGIMAASDPTATVRELRARLNR